MKIINLFLSIATVFTLHSCSNNKTNNNSATEKINNSKKTDSDITQTFSTDWKTLTKDFKTWYNYTYNNIILSEDFVSLDLSSNKIDKLTFLTKLMTENVVAFKTKIQQGKSVYQLFKLGSNDESIITTNRQMAATELTHFKMEGLEFPDFNFTDLSGKTYTKTNTKGKIIVLKCWFIGCVACVKEFPELNKLVDNYQGRNDILFISLAFDKKKELQTFLKTREFKYETIPEMRDFMNSEINITQFPTHLLIDRDGKIKKVVNKIEEMVPFLKLETESSH